MSDVQFEDLLAAATRISREHEQDLKQRADRSREEEARKRQEEERRQKSKRDAQAAIIKLREEEEKRRKQSLLKSKLMKERREQELLQRQKQQQRNPTDRKPADRKPTSRQPVRQNMVPEKPRVVQDLSFDEIMKRAKQVPTDKKTLIQQKRAPPSESGLNRLKPSASEVSRKSMPKASISTPGKSHTTLNKAPTKSSIYTSRPSSNNSAAAGGAKMTSVRDRLKNIALAPPQRLNTVKRDLRSVEEIQKDIRKQLGKAPNEAKPARERVRERQPIRRSLSPRSAPARDRAPERRPVRRSLSPRPRPQRPAGRMPFQRNQRRRYSDEEDDDLDGFIDDGDEEEDLNNYSEVISKMFRYDRKRYRDETFSDDDMEAGASDVLREETRSSRIARQEDLLEEQREREELERAHKRKLARQKKQNSSQ